MRRASNLSSAFTLQRAAQPIVGTFSCKCLYLHALAFVARELLVPTKPFQEHTVTRSFRTIFAMAATGFMILANVATAGTIMLSGKSTSGSPTWNRPLAGTPPTTLSGVGTATAYDVTAFMVGQTGTYTFQSTATSPANWDNFSFLYQNSFSAASPLANVLIGNDDNPTIGLSGFAYTLTAGVPYFFVETGFANTDSGAYKLSITNTGPIDITLMDTTAGGPTWNRPLAGNPPTGLSGVGTATRYDVTALSVDTAGSYEFQSTATNPANWDNFTFLYANAFSSAAPLANVLVGNDDNPTIGVSGFTRTLSANTNYFHVETGFANTDAGAYSLRIRDVTPAVVGVPEPETIALLGIALAGLALTRRRIATTSR